MKTVFKMRVKKITNNRIWNQIPKENWIKLILESKYGLCMIYKNGIFVLFCSVSTWSGIRFRWRDNLLNQFFPLHFLCSVKSVESRCDGISVGKIFVEKTNTRPITHAYGLQSLQQLRPPVNIFISDSHTHTPTYERQTDRQTKCLPNGIYHIWIGIDVLYKIIWNVQNTVTISINVQYVNCNRLQLFVVWLWEFSTYPNFSSLSLSRVDG